MIDKRMTSVTEAVADIEDGASVLVSGFGGAGSPIDLLHALLDQGAKDLTLISNNAGNGMIGMAALMAAGRVRKIVCSFPRSSRSEVFTETYRAGKIELEVVPQGTLAERIRCGGAGIPAFFTPTSAGTPLEEGKEIREIDGVRCVLEPAIKADVALVKALGCRPLGQPDLPQVGAQFRAHHVHGRRQIDRPGQGIRRTRRP